MRELPERLVDATVRRVAALPPGRLVSGRSRGDLAQVLARDDVWHAGRGRRCPTDAARPWEQLADDPGERTGSEGPSAVDLQRLEQQVAHLREREQRLGDKVAALRDEVDRLRRERDGAVARAQTAATAARDVRAQLEAAERAAAVARDEAAAADDRVSSRGRPGPAP